MCPKNSTVFPRTTKNGVLHVCLEVRYFPDGAGKSYDDARELCKEDNGVSLTGPAQNSEREFVKGLDNQSSCLNILSHLYSSISSSKKRVYIS